MLCATDARLGGMGRLSLLFPDILHSLDLYDFANIPAGFYKADTVSCYMLRGSGLKRSFTDGDISFLAIGQAIPSRLTGYAPVQAVSFFQVIPEFELVPCEVISFSRRVKEDTDFLGGKLSKRAWGVYAGYSQLSENYETIGESDVIRTPSLSLVYARPVSDKLDYGLTASGFYGMYASADGRYSASLFPVGGGGGIAYDAGKTDLGFNLDYNYPMFSFESSGYSDDFKGSAVSPAVGSVTRSGKITWANAVNYRWVKLNETQNDQPGGSLKIDGVTGKSQILFSPRPIRIALFGQFDQKRPIYKFSNGNSWFDVQFVGTLFGGGLGFTDRKTGIGVEGFYERDMIKDKLDDEKINGESIVLKVGGEYEVVKAVFLRGGLNYGTANPDLEDDDYRNTTYGVTGGLGFDLGGRIRIDIAYGYDEMKFDTDPSEKSVDHVVSFFLKNNLVKTAW